MAGEYDYMSKYILLANNLWFKYPRSSWILRGLNFRIRKGEKVLIMGQSGCGKSTLLHLIAGLYPSFMKGTLHGELSILGISCRNGLPKLRRYIGILLQNFEQELLGLTVEEEVLLDALNRGFSTEMAFKRCKEILKLLKLENLRTRNSLNLSYGEKQRVVLASILASNPEILIMDEPFSQIDSENAQILLNEIRRLQNKTILISEHRISKIINYVNRVLVLNRGIIAYDGVPTHDAKMYCEIPKLKINKRLGNDILTVRNLKCGYANTSLLYVKAMNVREGEILAITGPNGAGKTTLGMTLAGIIPPIGGEIYRRGRIYYIFQNPANNLIYKTVWDELFNPASKFNSNPYEIVYDLLDAFNLKGKEEQNPFTLSIGEKMRLAIASAIASRPAVIIIDEPTFGQDIRNLITIMKILHEYSSSGSHKFGVIILTHDEDFARKTSDRCINIKSLRM